jgi:hypothetical protein
MRGHNYINNKSYRIGISTSSQSSPYLYLFGSRGYRRRLYGVLQHIPLNTQNNISPIIPAFFLVGSTLYKYTYKEGE